MDNREQLNQMVVELLGEPERWSKAYNRASDFIEAHGKQHKYKIIYTSDNNWGNRHTRNVIACTKLNKGGGGAEGERAEGRWIVLDELRLKGKEERYV